MIYASLKPVQRWANRYVLPNYLLLGLASGGAWLALITAIVLPGYSRRSCSTGWRSSGSGLAALGKVVYWRFIDRSESIATPESATGLGAIGKVRLFAAPHTEENYLLKEMGYKVARKHALKLRLIALGLGFTAPAILVFLATFFSGWAAVLLLLSAGDDR